MAFSTDAYPLTKCGPGVTISPKILTLTGLICVNETSRKAFCDYSNAVLHNERITWAGFVATVINRQAFWSSPSKRSLTIVPPGQFRPSVISTITGGLLVGLVLEVQPLGRTTLRTKMLSCTASPTSAVKVDGRILYRYFLAVDGAVAARLDS